MRIKLAILDQDANYLSRIVSVFTNKFSDKLEVYSFTDLDVAISTLNSSKINVFVASDNYDIDDSLLPKNCGLAYLVESASIETFKEKPAICKYQKVEIIYKVILEIFSDNVSDSIGIKFDSDSSVRIISFVSASGGVGSSSAAAACAKSFATSGKKTLYINLEQFGSVEPFFSGIGQADFSDVIFALKSKKTNLSLKLESSVKQDPSSVFFYGSAKTALDMVELKTEDIQRLLTDLKLTGSYDNIIFDLDFSLSPSTLEVFKNSETIVFVSDGSEVSNIKFSRAQKAIEITEQKLDVSLMPRLCVFYNKFSNKTGKALDDGIRTIGGAPKYEHASSDQVISQLVSLGIFAKI